MSTDVIFFWMSMNFLELYKNQIWQISAQSNRLDELIWRNLSISLKKLMSDYIAEINRKLLVFLYNIGYIVNQA